MEGIKFVIPTLEYEEQAYEYINEFYEYNSMVHGAGGLDRYIGKYNEWLELLEKDRNRTDNDIEGKVPSETFMLIREFDNKLLGIINIRLKLNENLLLYGGHIGYGIRPTERRKGYNSYQLYLAMKYCLERGIDRVLLTCDKNNIGSAKTIINSGGILENEVILDDGSVHQRYWINVLENVKRLSKKYEN